MNTAWRGFVNGFIGIASPLLMGAAGVALILGGYYSLGYLLPDDWKSKYASRYGVSVEEVSLQEKPTSCDWWHAPIGDKGCHYDVVVRITRWNRSTDGKPIVSHDDGKTWQLLTPDELTPKAALKTPSALVEVRWRKIVDP